MGRRNARLVTYELTYEYHQNINLNGLPLDQITIIHREVVNVVTGASFANMLNQYPFTADKEQELITKIAKTNSIFDNFDHSHVRVRSTGIRDRQLGISTLKCG
jgi:hypothetical protein